METAVLAMIGTAALVSSAAVVAVACDRFNKVAASTVALIAGFVPWLFFLMWHNFLAGSTVLSETNLFGSGPLFLVAFLLYGVGQKTPRRGIAAGASLVGMLAGVGFSIVPSGLLSRMP